MLIALKRYKDSDPGACDKSGPASIIHRVLKSVTDIYLRITVVYLDTFFVEHDGVYRVFCDKILAEIRVR